MEGPWFGGGLLLAAARAGAEGVENPGATLYFVPGLESIDEFGRIFAVLGDVDGDGVKDFASSGLAPGRVNPQPVARVGHVDLLSGKTGALLRRWYAESSRATFRLGPSSRTRRTAGPR